MLFLVVALFLICWFPLQLYNFLNVYKPEINECVPACRTASHVSSLLVSSTSSSCGCARTGWQCRTRATTRSSTACAAYASGRRSRAVHIFLPRSRPNSISSFGSCFLVYRAYMNLPAIGIYLAKAKPFSHRQINRKQARLRRAPITNTDIHPTRRPLRRECSESRIKLRRLIKFYRPPQRKASERERRLDCSSRRDARARRSSGAAASAPTTITIITVHKETDRSPTARSSYLIRTWRTRPRRTIFSSFTRDNRVSSCSVVSFLVCCSSAFETCTRKESCEKGTRTPSCARIRPAGAECSGGERSTLDTIQ